MGASLLYGARDLWSWRRFAKHSVSSDAMAKVAVALVIAAFFLKAAVVPFHAGRPMPTRPQLCR